MSSKALEILKLISVDPEKIYRYSNKQIMLAIEELNKSADLAQSLFIKQELKYKKEIKELKLKFIEDIAFLKKDMN